MLPTAVMTTRQQHSYPSMARTRFCTWHRRCTRFCMWHRQCKCYVCESAIDRNNDAKNRSIICMNGTNSANYKDEDLRTECYLHHCSGAQTAIRMSTLQAQTLYHSPHPLPLLLVHEYPKFRNKRREGAYPADKLRATPTHVRFVVQKVDPHPAPNDNL